MAVRSILILLAAVSLVTSVRAIAVGLGEIRLHSTINQPLAAEIDLLSVEGREASQLRARLGSPEDFARAGIERPFFLTDLGFRPVLDNPGGPVLKITSSRPVREPFLDFLVRLEWPDGQLLRAYTLLLDLPDHGFRSSPGRAPTASSGPATFGDASSSAASDRGARPLRRPEQPRIQAGTTGYAVRQGDTLWSIASRSRPEGMTVQQTLMAIYQLNPDAFIDGDMNRMRRDYTLRVPEHSDVAAIDPDEARATVWREAVEVQPAPTPLDATGREPAAAGTATEEAGQLRLAAPQLNEASAGGAAVGISEEVAVAPQGVSDGVEGGTSDSDGIALTNDTTDKVLYLEEEVLLTRRENQELQERISNLEEQLATVSRLVELQSDTVVASRPAQQPSGANAGQAGMMRTALLVLAGIAVLVLLWALLRRRREKLSEEPARRFTPMAGAVGATAVDAAAADSPDELSPAFGTGAMAEELAEEPSEEEIVPDWSGESDLFARDETTENGFEPAAPAADETELDLDMADLDLSSQEEESHAASGDLAAFDEPAQGSYGQEDYGQEGYGTALESQEAGLSQDEDEVSLEDWFAELEQDQLAAPSPEAHGFDVPDRRPNGNDTTISVASESGNRLDATFDLDFAEFAAEGDPLAQRDPLETRLELARVYIDMQDSESAREILEELIEGGNPDQQREAQELLDSLS